MTEERVRRRLAAIVAADVAGYSRLMGADEEGTLAALKAHRAELIDPAVAEYGGRIVKTMGDGLLLEFPSVVDAVTCCIEIQRGMGRRNAATPPARRIDFRVGVNLGDVISEGDDIFGDGVNIAARLEGIADPGGVCVSETALQHVRGRIELDTEDMGERRLKNIDAPVRAFRIRNAGPPAPPVPGRHDAELPFPEPPPSLAILPFRNLGDDPKSAFIADGVALGVQTMLVQLPNMFFINACGHAGYREGRVGAAEAVAGLNVRYVLEGTVQHAGTRARITPQLTDLEKSAVIWAETYDRDLADIFAFQDEIARAVVAALSLRLLEDHFRPEFTGGLRSSVEWEHFLRGVNALYTHSKVGCETAAGHFEKLAVAHPEDALAYCYLALVHFMTAARGWAASKEAALAEAQDWAARSMDLKRGHNGLAHAVLGWFRLFERAHDESLKLCHTGVAHRSNCPFALQQLALTQTYSGQPGGGIKRAREAMSLRVQPTPPQMETLAMAYRDFGEFPISIRAAEEAQRMDPAYPAPRVTLCSDFALSGDLDNARRAAGRIIEADPAFTIARFAERQPYREAAALERVTNALAAAGLPA